MEFEENKSSPDEIIEIPGTQQPSRNNANRTREFSYDNFGKRRFQDVAKKVINLNRVLTAEDIWLAGQDPGIDANHVDSNIYANCHIFCSDYNEEQTSKVELTNGTLSEFLKKERPKDSKVRWINVDGISWDVIKTLAIHFDLHPLCVEDIIQGSQRIKMDQYDNHMYISLLLHTLDELEGATNLGRRDSMIVETNDYRKSILRKTSRTNLLYYGHPKGSTYLTAHKALRKMKLHIVVEQVNIILLNDGTLITIFQHSGVPVCNPILLRIDHPKTILRISQDGSLLMEAVIDAIVDLALPIVDSYRHQIAELEGKLLIRPKMDYMRELHMISGELALLKKTLTPIRGLVIVLRKHSGKSPISELAKTYFSDVADHCIYIEDNLEAMLKITENLVNLVFNLIAYDTNENMSILAVLSIVFLPMTFIAGVFGMNFHDFPELDQPLSYFWWVTGITTCAITLIFTFRMWTKWIGRFYRYLYRKFTR